MSKKIRRKAWLLALEAAVLLSVPFLIPHTGVVSLIAFVPLFMLDELLRSNRTKTPFLYYYTSFLVFNILTTWWIWNISAGGAIAAIALNALQMAVIFALFRWSRKKLDRGLSLLFFAVTWIAWEHIYFMVEISWPWLCLGNSFANTTHLVQWYEITGSVGGSAWILLCNILIYLALVKKDRRKTLIPAAAFVIAVPMLLSVVRYHNYQESSDPIEVVAVQPNIDPLSKFGVTEQRSIDEKMISLARKCITPTTEYVITPETFTYNVDTDHPFQNESVVRYSDFLSEYPSTNLVFGATAYRLYRSNARPTETAKPFRGGWLDSFNAVFVMDSSAVLDKYYKSKLVPGAECVPYARFLFFLEPLFSSLGGTSSSYGRSEAMEALGGSTPHKLSTMICYESIYGEYSRTGVSDGASFVSVITNDGWWGDTPGYHQHFNFARLRSIEYRRDLVQVANTGTSGTINQRGDILNATPWWVETSFNATVNGNDALTPFVKYGDVTGRCSCLAFVLLLLLSIVQGFKASRTGRR